MPHLCSLSGCGQCMAAYYCSAEHQRRDLCRHKIRCEKPVEEQSVDYFDQKLTKFENELTDLYDVVLNDYANNREFMVTPGMILAAMNGLTELHKDIKEKLTLEQIDELIERRQSIYPEKLSTTKYYFGPPQDNDRWRAASGLIREIAHVGDSFLGVDMYVA